MGCSSFCATLGSSNQYCRNCVERWLYGPKERKDYLTKSNQRRFILRRDVDESGVSGTGVVAEGVEFSDGSCAMSWLTEASSIGIYPNIKELNRIHGHGGKAYTEYID